ncbi:aldo-keto reductase family 1 member B1-like [Sitodiplosis mosellana]|uniref:aldo-keto reductase family 1 member B1-like n=1 Tax=Sitodiplosis mosellana TaxID=263140 RepID=UPI0024443DC0|nr:aldo-keto reductase family 1 member B1-like [Sitodiplosis mosellana]
MATVPSITLNNGLKMPAFGLGTYGLKGGEGIAAIKKAIDIGYRHLDTAFLYNNEQEVGEAVRDKIAEGVISRSDMLVVSKLWCTFHEPERVEYACRKSLENLELDYIDLYIMHAPVGFVYHDDETVWPKNADGTQETNDVDYLETWRAMEKLVDLGLVKSIGLSNFNSEQVDRVVNESRIKPVSNQVECSPMHNQKKLTAFCKERDVVLVAYCPLARQQLDARKEVQDIAAKYNKTPAQICLRYLVELGVVPIPKSANEERILQNISIFDFKLSKEDIKAMDSLNTNERIVKFSDAKHAKYWPFGLEF